MRSLQSVLVTGGAGFIGSNFVRFLLSQADFTGTVINADRLTYSGNLRSLIDVDKRYGGTRYFFERLDICDSIGLAAAFEAHHIDTVVNFAAESHVDRSILGPREFVRTNIEGTFTLLEAARAAWGDRRDVLFHHVSTDEVYGSLGPTGSFGEESRYDPRSPYAATKAAADHLVRSYWCTYGLPTTLSNCSNNYGPYQFPEKVIPLMILNMLEDRPLPIYGDGKNVRDWLFVEDHCSALWSILRNGRMGESYNVGGENEWENNQLVNVLCEKVATAQGRPKDTYKRLVRYVTDRPGHDRRYSIDCGKIKQELGWRRSVDFDGGLERTVRWYLDNAAWVAETKSGEYQDWIRKNYSTRPAKQ